MIVSTDTLAIFSLHMIVSTDILAILSNQNTNE